MSAMSKSSSGLAGSSGCLLARDMATLAMAPPVMTCAQAHPLVLGYEVEGSLYWEARPRSAYAEDGMPNIGAVEGEHRLGQRRGSLQAEAQQDIEQRHVERSSTDADGVRQCSHLLAHDISTVNGPSSAMVRAT